LEVNTTRLSLRPASQKEVSSLTKQKQAKISKIFGVNDNTLIFAPAFEKA